MKRFVIVLFVLLALLVVPTVAAQEETPPDETAGEVVDQPVDEVQPGDVIDESGAVVEDEGPGPQALLLAVGLLVIAAAFVYERGFEFVISKPVFERFWPDQKAFQSWVVLVVGSLAAYLLKGNLLQFVTIDGQPLRPEEVVAQGLSGAIVAVAAMVIHSMRRKDDDLAAIMGGPQ